MPAIIDSPSDSTPERNVCVPELMPPSSMGIALGPSIETECTAPVLTHQLAQVAAIKRSKFLGYTSDGSGVRIRTGGEFLSARHADPEWETKPIPRISRRMT